MQPTSKGWVFILHLLEVEVSPCVICNSFSGKKTHSFIDWFNYVFASLWIQGYLLYTWSYNSILCNFLAQCVLDVSTGSSFPWLLGPFDPSHQCECVYLLFCFILHFSSFTALYDAPNSSCIFSIPALESHFSLLPWLLLLEIAVRKEDLSSQRALHCWSVLASRPSQLTEQWKACVRINLHIPTSQWGPTQTWVRDFLRAPVLRFSKWVRWTLSAVSYRKRTLLWVLLLLSLRGSSLKGRIQSSCSFMHSNTSCLSSISAGWEVQDQGAGWPAGCLVRTLPGADVLPWWRAGNVSSSLRPYCNPSPPLHVRLPAA